MAEIVNLTDAQFEAQVLQAEGAVLVDFWAAWCAPCRMMEPTLEKLASELDGQLAVVKVDVQENLETPTRLGVMNIPTLVLFRQGEEIKRFVGAIPSGRLAKQVQEALQS